MTLTYITKSSFGTFPVICIVNVAVFISNANDSTLRILCLMVGICMSYKH